MVRKKAKHRRKDFQRELKEKRNSLDFGSGGVEKLKPSMAKREWWVEIGLRGL